MIEVRSSERPSRLKTVAAFAAIYLIWGSTYLAIRYAVETIPPFLMMGTRSVLAGAALYLIGRAQGGGRVEREHWPALIIIGALFFLFGHGSLAWAEQRVPSGLAAVLIASEPLWIAAIESVAFRTVRVRWVNILGLVLGFAGTAYLVIATSGLESLGGNPLWSVVVVASAIFWSCGAVYSRAAKLPESAKITAGVELCVGGILLIVAGLIMGEGSRFAIANVSLRSLLSWGYLILFGSIITFSAYVWLLGVTSATRVSTHTYVNPIVAILLGALVGGEPLIAEVIFATVVILISVCLVLYHPTAKLRLDR